MKEMKGAVPAKTREPPVYGGSLLYGVEVTGLEPATAWSQTRNATNCATPRFCGCKGTHYIEE